ncbi:cation channel sperm-associated auxiliary subunit delta-like [Sphaerodactylus townsendi]|uniref:cation channel sperm-associated auxiliary subunit delta-like n=1 Tax=Sphaerodactylus townsendi TaxID=933632 RepID=UPI00202678AB|nr:cation channel sperm-associated auxiliary subunit delta-like [Sphaerodactylus townsendi]
MIQTIALWKFGICLALLVRLLLGLAQVNNGSWPCSSERLVYSSQSFHSQIVAKGTQLLYGSPYATVLQHPCRNNFVGSVSPAIYLGKQVFLSFDGFESSLLPLTIPVTLATAPAKVSAAVFVQGNHVVLAINGKVFVYFYKPFKSWKQSKGINSRVTEITNTICCYAPSDPKCDDISTFVLAYGKGNLISAIPIFYSEDGGYTFKSLQMSPLLDGTLVSAYNFVTLSRLGMLISQTKNNMTIANFVYSLGYNEYSHQGTPFDTDKDEEHTITVPPGLRGFIIIHTKNIFLLSSNNGLTTENIDVYPTEDYPNASLPLHSQGVVNVAATSNEIAALTKNQKLFYGSLDIVFSKMVLIGDKNGSTVSTHEVLMFDNTGMLTILTPVSRNETGFHNFHKCIINLQNRLMDLHPHLTPCPVEILSGDFHEKMFYIDMKQKLHFNVTFVPKPGTGAFPYVTVSNPHALGFLARVNQEGYTKDGNIKFNLQIILLQQHNSGMAESEFHDKVSSAGMSTLTVDIYNKGIFCIDMHPLTALIAMDCPPTKHIRPFKNGTVCDKGLFNKTNLQDSFSYIIKQDVYDPRFLGRQDLDQEDLNVSYSYEHLGCPVLLYYDSPWLPTLELWENDEFVEYVSADFVLFETNGMHNYDYLLTASEAKCISQPQNWSTMFELQLHPDPHTAWSRTNYESCKVPNQVRPLESPSIKYQILNLNEDNRVVFSQYNGIYVFKVIVVDTIYSYCELSTLLSVYVHGAFPKSQINAAGMLIGFLILILGLILMGYFFPKLLQLHGNAKMKFL